MADSYRKKFAVEEPLSMSHYYCTITLRYFLTVQLKIIYYVTIYFPVSRLNHPSFPSFVFY